MKKAFSIQDAVGAALVTMKMAGMGRRFSGGIPNGRYYLTCAETAKLVRQVLKLAFPDTKFSVRSKVYSGGASIWIRWADGPSANTVKSAVSLFEGATFDAMRDLKEFRTFDFNGERISFGADFIFCIREEGASSSAC